jgi:hypothetical protein
MPYKEKTCPVCHVKHNKRGVYCSRSCGNQKAHTEETKAKLSEKQREWMTSGDEKAEVQKHNYISKRINGEPDPIPPQKPIDIGVGRFVQDGDLWEEV